MSPALVWITFIASAAVIVIAGMRLSYYSDIIATRTHLGGFLVGSIFLAMATSLPEVVTSVSSGFLGVPEIAVGNVLGSNLFNLAILAVADWVEGRGGMLARASREHLSTAYLGLILTAMAGLAVAIRPNFMVLGVGIDTILIILTYAAGMFVISQRSSDPEDQLDPQSHSAVDEVDETDSEGSNNGGLLSLPRVFTYFMISAAVIVAAGTMMSRTADQLAVITGLGGTFVGSIFVAFATSLPELVASVSAVRIGAIDLAVGNVLGSNVFNMIILLIADISYPHSAILSSVAPVNALTALSSCLLTLIVIISLSKQRLFSKMQADHFRSSGPVQSRRLGLDTTVILVGYVISTYLIYSLN